MSNTSAIEQTPPAFTPRLVYRFIDSSVPPQYHRSYTINVKPPGVELTVDCYGDILAAYTLSLAEKDHQRLLTELRQTTVHPAEPDENKGCAGGTTDSFDILLDDLNISGHVYHCAEKRYGTLTGDTDNITRLFKALVPGLTDKIKV